MDVLEDHQQRLLARGALDELARCEEEALAVDYPLGLVAEQERKALLQLGFGGNDAHELLARDIRGVVVVDARHLLHVLGEGSVGGALAVGNRPAPNGSPPWDSTRRANSSARRLLPMPAGPITVTRWGRRSSRT